MTTRQLGYSGSGQLAAQDVSTHTQALPPSALNFCSYVNHSSPIGSAEDHVCLGCFGKDWRFLSFVLKSLCCFTLFDRLSSLFSFFKGIQKCKDFSHRAVIHPFPSHRIGQKAARNMIRVSESDIFYFIVLHIPGDRLQTGIQCGSTGSGEELVSFLIQLHSNSPPRLHILPCGS